MKHILKYILPALIVGSAFLGVAHAQVSIPPVVKKVGTNIVPVASGTTIGSSTVNGAFNNLNVSGTCTGCNAGGTTTSTINGVTGPTFTFSVVSTSSASSVTTSSQQVFLNLLKYTSSTDITISSTGTIVFANHNISQFTNDSGYITATPSGISNTGNVTSTTFTANSTSSPSVITDFDTVLYASANEQGLDHGTYVNTLCTAGVANASSVAIMFPQEIIASSSWTVPITDNKAGGKCAFYGQGNATQWNYGGANGTVAVLFDASITNKHRPSPYISKIMITNGNGNVASSTGPIGVQFGSTNGADMATADTFSVSNFGINVLFGANTYGAQITGLISQGGGELWHVNGASNSGEGINCDKCHLADSGNGNASDTIVWAANSVEKGSITNSQMDMAGTYIGSGVLSLIYDNDTFETSNPTAYPPYDIIDQQSSANGTNFFLTNSQIMQDATSTAGGLATEFINCGSNMQIENVAVNKNASATTTPRFLNNTNSTANCNATFKGVINTLNTAYTALGPSGNSAVTDATQILTLPRGGFIQGWVASSSNEYCGVNGNGCWISNTIPSGGGNTTSRTLIGTNGTSTATLQVKSSVSSTIMVGDNNVVGCYEWGLSSGVLYVYGTSTAGGSLIATTTKPASNICM